ncbi:hypothetical protein COY05_03655 [Candidatus Peregrinibacteria bacterium CG_4_10_14_0_2_um_filter_38_24]|nr:MAG: hypothetical protein COY05_03655 [Candidatus Peregrinibacteria bacterium CG_4_10_14_0_2_um_filter_38_24]PJC39390.1 MAG: hypothetical protein CO044_00035 [Candidatus Peregrinibacteria bacterium CG_4_9_14_0_2_um_filter_38_9]
MNKFIRNFITLGTTLVIFSGCSLFGINPEKDGDKIVKEGLSNFYDVRVSSFSGSLKSGVVDNTTGDLNFDLSFSGSSDFQDPKNLLLNLKLDGTGFMGENSENLSGEVKINKSDLYFLVSKISSFGGMITEDVTKPLLGQWWRTQLPQDIVDSLQKSSIFGDDSKLTPEEIKLKKLLKNTQFFSGAKYMREISGEYLYETALDNEAVKTFVDESRKIYGEESTVEQMNILDANLKNSELKATFWVGVEDKTVHKAEININANDTISGMKLDVAFKASISDINVPVTVEAPEGVKEFDPMALFSGVAQ